VLIPFKGCGITLGVMLEKNRLSAAHCSMFVRGLAERDEQKMEPQSLYLDTPITAARGCARERE
jgi:hypothetical protein